MFNDSHPLGIAVFHNDTTTIDLLLASQADVDFAPDPNIGPAIRVSCFIQIAIITLLYNITCPQWAVIYGHVEALKVLMYYHADCEYIDNHGCGLVNTCLDSIYQTTDPRITIKIQAVLMALLAHGAPVFDVNMKSLLEICPLTSLGIIPGYLECESQVEELISTFVAQINNLSQVRVDCIIQFLALNSTKDATYVKRQFEYLLPNTNYDYFTNCVSEINRICLVTSHKTTPYKLLNWKSCINQPTIDLKIVQSLLLDDSYPLYRIRIEHILAKFENYIYTYRIATNSLEQFQIAFRNPLVLQGISKYLSTIDFEKLLMFCQVDI
ncbi:hypothetical protein QAD02_011667 [Eretmocerus hayati]|uniref:Uncharacterized protein n=1 Tax=Eretmocerus hayati TaxID=131215 RepID=A0ACC2NZ71_9HYME|nr:hypothetical protein QAD02_011667 [Eretmocerus hayati]